LQNSHLSSYDHWVILFGVDASEVSVSESYIGHTSSPGTTDHIKNCSQMFFASCI